MRRPSRAPSPTRVGLFRILRIDDHWPDLVRGVLPSPSGSRLDSEYRRLEPCHRFRLDYDWLPDDYGLALSSPIVLLRKPVLLAGRAGFLRFVLRRVPSRLCQQIRRTAHCCSIMGNCRRSGLFRLAQSLPTTIHRLSTSYPHCPPAVDEYTRVAFSQNVENIVDN